MRMIESKNDECHMPAVPVEANVLMKKQLERGISLREALDYAKDVGCMIDYPRRTGEVRVTSPDGRRSRINGRRKDASLKLLSLIRQTARSV